MTALRNRALDEQRRVMEELREASEEMRQAAEHIRSTAMQNIEAQEKARDAAELVRQSLAHRMQKFLDDAPRIMEIIRQSATEQWKEAEKVSQSARDMLYAAQQLLQKTSDQIERMNKTQS